MASERARIGMLGIMQELYDEMIPRITEHQGEFSRQLCERLAPAAEVIFTRPARNRDDIEEIVKDLNAKNLDGIMIVMLTYGPAMRAQHVAQFEMDPNLTPDNHEYAIRFEITLRGILAEGGYDGISVHFEPVGRDGRFKQLPLLAASNMMADGFGYGAEGDTNAATLICAGHTLIGNAHFSEMYAMDYDLDSVLISHMGEGNWRIARSDRPVRLVDRPLGIGGLDNPPTTVFSAEPGIATTATLIALEGEHYRLAVARGEVLDTPELPLVQMPYFHFRPDSGMRGYLTAWLRSGGTHHFCLNLGDHVDRWRMLAELLDIDFVGI